MTLSIVIVLVISIAYLCKLFFSYFVIFLSICIHTYEEEHDESSSPLHFQQHVLCWLLCLRIVGHDTLQQCDQLLQVARIALVCIVLKWYDERRKLVSPLSLVFILASICARSTPITAGEVVHVQWLLLCLFVCVCGGINIYKIIRKP